LFVWLGGCNIAAMCARYRRGWCLLALALVAGLPAGCTAWGTADVPGAVERFDPIAALPAIASFAGANAKLLKLRADAVRPDGTIDLSADYHPQVSYELLSSATESDVKYQPPRPPGEGLTVGDPVRVRIGVRAPFWYSKRGCSGCSGPNSGGLHHRGMERELPSRLSGENPVAPPPPRCGAAQLWAAAIAAGASKDVVARLEYPYVWDSRSQAPRYHLELTGSRGEYDFDGDCHLSRPGFKGPVEHP
jgi:hypothetical protein